ncbi:MAG: hypothetical protein IJA10_08755 [Lachnospiraceae bacterium]|nr:hypothetical protein [Lachnospiraceae bacterium]
MEEFMVGFEEEEIEKDMDYLSRLVPGNLLHLTSLISDECDKMEQEGSMMFDEYLDKEQVLRLSAQIFNRCNECAAHLGSNPNLKDFIQVLLCDEMCKRRMRHHNRMRRFQYFN